MDNLQRLLVMAKIVDKADPDYNTDMDIIVPGTTKTYRDMILAGYDATSEEAHNAFSAKENGLDLEL